MDRIGQEKIMGAVLSMTYSLYPIEMTENRNALVRKALEMLGKDCTEQELEELLFALHQSKIDLHPGCQCLINNGYYPDDFTDSFRKLDLMDETGQAARELYAVLKHPQESWEPQSMYAAIRAVYNKEYDAQRIHAIQTELQK